MKKINILNNAKENLLQNKNLEAIANLEWLFEADLETFEMEIDTKIVVNDKMVWIILGFSLVLPLVPEIQWLNWG